MRAIPSNSSAAASRNGKDELVTPADAPAAVEAQIVEASRDGFPSMPMGCVVRQRSTLNISESLGIPTRQISGICCFGRSVR